jgi:ribosomal protein S18 acetylase RimI-like enzyme
MTGSSTVEIVPFLEEHLRGVIRLCIAERWPSFPGDPERALRVLTAPGVTTVIARDDGEVVGFAQLFSDGELQAFLATLAVDERFRGRGIGRALVSEALRLAGGERIDLLSEDEAVGFYESFPNFKKPGFRLYPFHARHEGQSDLAQS